jgi:radical SAM protein with 4Fe4S-binding SPASM domain
MKQNTSNQKYRYSSRVPLKAKPSSFTKKQWKLLVESDNFCMMPWVHMHAYPDGRVYPCCVAEYHHSIGNLQKTSMEEVWNGEGYRQLRRNMMADKPSKQCSRCYEQEKNKLFSMRNESNRTYGHHVGLVDQTDETGYNPDFHLRYWDIRFSNLCNFKCRTCGPAFSSQWFKDHKKMYGKVPDALGRELNVIEYAGGSEDSILEQMEQHIPTLEQVYFAGGEPLIMKEHYYLLEKLIEYGKTDITLQYNTNFSELRYKDKHVFDYWKHFKNVSVGASLDGSGTRGELIRKGQNWTQTVQNRERMIQEVPHVDFYVSSTVSSLNVLHILDFHREWTELGLVKAKDWNVNLCQSPQWYRPDALPVSFRKDVVIPAIEKHIEWLKPQDPLTRATVGYKGIINFINNDNNANWQEFIDMTSEMDNFRNENFWDIFTEYAVIRP